MENIEEEDPVKQEENVVFHYTDQSKGEWDNVTINLLGLKIPFSYQDILIKSILSNQFEYDNPTTIGILINTSLFQLVANYILIYYNENIEEYSRLDVINRERYFSIGDIVVSLNQFIVSKLMFQTIRVGGDGNCLFRSLAQRQFGDQEKYNEIRQETVNYFLKQFQDLGYDTFKEQYNINDNDKIRRIPKLDENYFKNMLKDGQWGDTLQVIAFANLEPYFNAFTITDVPNSSLLTSYPFGYPNENNLPTNTVFLKNYSGAHYDLLIPTAFDINFDNSNNFNNNIQEEEQEFLGKGLLEEGEKEIQQKKIKEQIEISPGKFQILFTNNDEYIGDIKDGKPEGTGELRFSQNNENGYQEYKGQFYEGQMSGQGIVTFEDGAIYEGQFKNGLMNGQGQLEYTKLKIQTELEPYQTWLQNFKGTIIQIINDYKIQGNYDNTVNTFVSNITENNPDDKIIVSYNGQFVDGEKSGQGTMIFKNGDVYTGEFFEDNITGKGEYKTIDKKSKYLLTTRITDIIITQVTNFINSYPQYDGSLVEGKRT
jgi:hypothetical protein